MSFKCDLKCTKKNVSHPSENISKKQLVDEEENVKNE